MTKFVGRRGGVAIAKETSRGVAGTTLFWMPFAKMTFDDNTVTVRETQGLGKISDGDSVYVTQQSASGDIDAQIYDKALGLLLGSIFGAMPVTSGGSPYTQTYTLNQTNQAPSLTIYYQDPDFTKAFRNAVVDMWKMKVTMNGIVDHTFSFKSKVGADQSVALTPNYTSLGTKFLHQHLSFKLASNIAGLSGASAISLQDLELDINRNAILDSALGTVEPEDVLNQQLAITGKIKLNKTDDSYRQLMLNGTYKSMEIKLTNGANSILTLQFPRVSFTQWAQDRSLDKIVSQDIVFTANYDAANALDVVSTATLVNLQSSY